MAQETRETLPSNAEGAESTSAISYHGVEVAAEFKPVEHPIEPIDHDQPIICPLPEPSILNDGRTQKKWMPSVSTREGSDLPVVKEGLQHEAAAGGGKMELVSVPPKLSILPSRSAPEHNIVSLLEECNATGDRSAGF